MQSPFSCVPETFNQIEGTLSAARIERYLAAAGGDKHYALRLYIWNIRLCEACYLPAQIGEVAVRNAIHKALREKHGENWFERGSFLCTIPQRLRDELDSAIRGERKAYGTRMTVDHLVSGLSFGFWLHLLTKKYDDVFWPHYFQNCFPNKPPNIDRQKLYDRADIFRIFRNRIAHHKPIFDRAPTIEIQNTLELTKWVCTETQWLVKDHLMRLGQAISSRPTC